MTYEETQHFVSKRKKRGDEDASTSLLSAVCTMKLAPRVAPSIHRLARYGRERRTCKEKR